MSDRRIITTKDSRGRTRTFILRPHRHHSRRSRGFYDGKDVLDLRRGGDRPYSSRPAPYIPAAYHPWVIGAIEKIMVTPSTIEKKYRAATEGLTELINTEIPFKDGAEKGKTMKLAADVAKIYGVRGRTVEQADKVVKDLLLRVIGSRPPSAAPPAAYRPYYSSYPSYSTTGPRLMGVDPSLPLRPELIMPIRSLSKKQPLVPPYKGITPPKKKWWWL